MNILLLHYAAPPIVGGVESVMAWHARLMSEAGHRVSVVAGRGGPMMTPVSFRAIPELDSRHAQVLSLKAELDAGRVPEAFEPFADRLAAHLQGYVEAADCVIAHNVCSLNKNLALTSALHRLSKDRSKPGFILWHHDLAWTTPRYRAELHDGYPWDLLRQDWPWAQQVVVSEDRRHELSELLHVPLERVCVVPNGVDASSFFKLSVQGEALCRDLRLLSSAPLILLPVRITSRKNIEYGLRMLAALRKDCPAAALIVTGPLGPHNPANEQYFQSLLSLRGELRLEGAAHFLAELVDSSIPDDVIADLYKVADLLFLPSREEGFGIPLLEAGLARIPVFCSDIQVLRELGGEQANYFSLDDDPAQVASRLASALSPNATYALRKRVLGSYTWQGIYQREIAPLLGKGS